MTEELLNALKLIQDECKKYGLFTCSNCPMRNSFDECGLIEKTPNNWSLEKREVYF